MFLVWACIIFVVRKNPNLTNSLELGLDSTVTLPLTVWVTMEKKLHFLIPSIPQLVNGANNSTYFIQSFWLLKEIAPVKAFAKSLAEVLSVLSSINSLFSSISPYIFRGYLELPSTDRLVNKLTVLFSINFKIKLFHITVLTMFKYLQIQKLMTSIVTYSIRLLSIYSVYIESIILSWVIGSHIPVSWFYGCIL